MVLCNTVDFFVTDKLCDLFYQAGLIYQIRKFCNNNAGLSYLVNKARLIEKIAELVRDKKIDGITEYASFQRRNITAS